MFQPFGRVPESNGQNSQENDLNVINQNQQNNLLPQMPFVPTYSQNKSPQRDRPINDKTSNMNRSLGSQNSFFMTTWGRSLSGQKLAPNQTNTIQTFGNQIQFATAGEEHTMIINQKQELFSCGSNKFGQLGIPNTSFISAPSSIPSLRNIKIITVACGSHHTFALSEIGEVFSWGLNLKGQLGLGNYENYSSPQIVHSLLPPSLEAKEKRMQKESKQNSSQMISRRIDDQQIQPNQSIEDLIHRVHQANKEPSQREEYNVGTLLQDEERILAISCGTFHTIVTSTRGRIFSAGYGETFALGSENTKDRALFEQIGLPNNKREIIKIISCGLTHSACVVGDKVYVWGIVGVRQSLIFKEPKEMEFPQDTSIIDIKSGDCYILFLSSKGEVFCLSKDSISDTPIEKPQKLEKLLSMKQISVGSNYSIGLTSDSGWIYGWGSNHVGQITGCIGPKSIFIDPVKIMKIPADVTEVGISCCYTLSMITAKKMIQKSEFQFSNNVIQIAGSETDIKIQDLKKKAQLESDRYTQLIQEKQQEIQTLSKNNINLIKTEERNAIDIDEYKRKEKEIIRQIKEIQDKNQTLIAQFEGRPASAKPVQNQNENQKFAIQGIDKFRNISEGGYGIIYRAKWRETTVAVKKFKVVNNENSIKDFLSECHAMEVMRHPNIVMFIGACTQAPNFCIVLEYCQKGSLWSLLQKSENKLSWDDRKRIALDIARGIFYLHSFNPPILHRDLKSLNLLLDDSGRCKLADFGWTKTLTEDNYMTPKIGTYQWMAPEVITSDHYTEKADVFSFAIILWEIVSREPPFKSKQGQQVSQEVVEKELRPSIPKNSPPQFTSLMQKCWDRNPDLRPGFKEIIRELERMTFLKTS